MVAAITSNPALTRLPEFVLDYPSRSPAVSAEGALKLVTGFKALTFLRMKQVPLTPALARALARAPSRNTLRRVAFLGSKIDGAALAELATLPNLSWLFLHGGAMPASALAAFHRQGAFPKLEELLFNVKVGDEGLALLAGSPVAARLKKLDVGQMGYTANGAKVLEPLVKRGVVAPEALQV